MKNPDVTKEPETPATSAPASGSVRFTGWQAIRIGMVVAITTLACGRDGLTVVVSALMAGGFAALVAWTFHEN